MLKISSETEEQNSHRPLRWWEGGAARLLAHEAGNPGSSAPKAIRCGNVQSRAAMTPAPRSCARSRSGCTGHGARAQRNWSACVDGSPTCCAKAWLRRRHC